MRIPIRRTIRTDPNEPRLALRFGVYAAVAAALAAAVGLALAQHNAARRGERNASADAAFVAGRLAGVLVPADLEGPVPPARARLLDGVFGFLAPRDSLRVNLFAPSGMVTYSSERALVGTKSGADVVEKVMRGEVLRDVMRLNGDRPRPGANPKVIESYVPVRLAGSARPAGALELFRDYAPYAAEIRGDFVSRALTIALALLLLYAALFPILRRVTRERRRAAGALEARARQQRAVAELGMRALVNPDLDELMGAAVELVGSTLALDRVSLWRVLPDGETLLLEVGTGWVDGQVGSLTIGSDSQAGHTLRTRAAVISLDRATETRFPRPAVAGIAQASTISVVIEGTGRPFGVLGGDTATPRVFSDDDASFVQLIANVVGGAVRRREAEDELRAAETRYRTLVEQLPLATYTSDLNGRATYVSPQIEFILGLPAATVVNGGTFWKDRLHRDDRERVVEAWNAWRRTSMETPSTCMYRLNAEDGRLVWVMDEAIAIRDESGAVAYFQGFIRDITERKLAEEALAHERYLLQTLMENSPDHVYFKDTEGRFLRASRSTAEWFGAVDPAELVGRTDADFFAPEVAGRWAEEERRLLDTGTPMVAAVEKEAWSGRPETWVSTTKVPLRGPGGEIVGLFGISRDVTESRRAAEEIAESEERFRTVFDAALVPMVVLDDEQRFVDANPAACTFYGLRKEELLRRRLPELLTPEARAGHDDRWAALLATGERQGESGIVRPDGSHRTMIFSAKANIQPGRHLSVQYDVTDQRRLEDQLRQAQKMESVGRLAGGIAHDFNNLLTAINGYSEFMLMRLGEDDPLRHDAEEIQRAAGRATSLTGQLLAFGRRQVLQPKVLDLNAVVLEMDKMLRRLIGEDVELLTVADPELGKIRADPGQIEQVIVNLAVNARDAMPTGGKLTIETANVETGGAFVLLAISDTGVGMDEQTRAQAFEPFFTTKATGEGTGLGLSTVHGIVEQSGGSIELCSEPGAGSTFKIYLPRVAADVEVEAARTNGSRARGSETVLLVEDEVIVRGLVREILEQGGYRVLEAGHGKDALEVSGSYEGSIDLVITDVVMPEMGGRELAERLAELRPDTRVLFTSGYPNDAVVQRGLLDTRLAFLQKPFTHEALTLKVREMLDLPLKTLG